MPMFRSLMFAAMTLGFVLATSGATAGEAALTGQKKINVLVVAGGHPYPVKPFRAMFADYSDMDCTFVDEKQGGEAFEDVSQWPYDAIVLYNYQKKPTKAQWANFLKLMDRGVGLVILHHAIYGYRPNPEFQKIVGVTSWLSGTKDNVAMKIHIADPQHSVTKGLNDFSITDETYKGHELAPTVHVLLTTDEPSNAKAIAWVHAYRKSPVCYFQLGHGEKAYANAQFAQVLGNAIRWSVVKSPHSSATP
jgi:uncharacterized protein